jgi:hypothetical protein
MRRSAVQFSRSPLLLVTCVVLLYLPSIQSFSIGPFGRRLAQPQPSRIRQFSASADTDDSDATIVDAEIVNDAISLDDPITLLGKKDMIGNLVADDEWAGVTMELGELVKKAVLEDIKSKGREFLGKDEYKIGDLSKEIDARVKQGVADIRGKPEYEVGDLVITLDEFSKNMTEQLTGKPYEVGDLSIELDRRIKNAVADYVGKEEYEAGDLTRAVTEKVTSRVDELLANYEFGDITREVNRRREEWVKSFLGEEAAANYKFGDVSKKLATMITGKEEYQFGDVSKKILGNLFGGKGNSDGGTSTSSGTK